MDQFGGHNIDQTHPKNQDRYPHSYSPYSYGLPIRLSWGFGSLGRGWISRMRVVQSLTPDQAQTTRKARDNPLSPLMRKRPKCDPNTPERTKRRQQKRTRARRGAGRAKNATQMRQKEHQRRGRGPAPKMHQWGHGAHFGMFPPPQGKVSLIRNKRKYNIVVRFLIVGVHSEQQCRRLPT